MYFKVCQGILKAIQEPFDGIFILKTYIWTMSLKNVETSLKVIGEPPVELGMHLHRLPIPSHEVKIVMGLYLRNQACYSFWQQCWRMSSSWRMSPGAALTRH